MAQLKTMRGRLVRIMLIISGLTGVATFATVGMMSVDASSRHLAEIQEHIEQGIASKGKVLTDNHALALRSLILDNAFLDMQRLLERGVREDEELVYGLFVNAEKQALASSIHGQKSASDEPPDPEAWKRLGLDAAELLVDQRVVERVNRLGEELLEVAVPVLGDDGEKLGTLRYGLSTRRMREALDRASVERDERLLRSVGWIAGVVFATTLLGLLLSRLLAIRITRPVMSLTDAARDLGSGNRSVRVDIKSGDELELLGSTFNHMVDELGSSYQKLEEMNRTLEQKVEARTAEIALRNRDMQLVLDNVDQGLVTLSPAGAMLGGCSRQMLEWFGPGEENQQFADYAGRVSRSFGEAFHCAWSQLVDACLPLELAIEQLPMQMRAGGRTWSLRYLPYFGDEKLSGVLVVAAEITERLVREREEAEQRELMQSFTRLMRDRNGFTSFLREADQMVSSICAESTPLDAVELKRTLHTLKGNAAIMGLSLVSAACHALEEQLALGEPMSPLTLSELAERWRSITEQVSALVPTSAQANIEVRPSQYSALLERLSGEPEHAELLARVTSWRLEPVTQPLRRLAQQAEALAQRLGKPDLQVVVQSDGLRLEPEHWRPLFSEMVHLVRNAIDHGIELPEERELGGKPRAGQLELIARTESDAITFEVSDDGRGIDWVAIAERGRQLGLPHGTGAELLDVLCSDGVTTRTEATDTSGRGVGMAALRRCVERLNGQLDVRSSAQQGTTWLIRFPRVGGEGRSASSRTTVAAETALGAARLTA